MDAYSFANQSIKQWNQILNKEYVPSDVEDKILEILEALEYIDGWEPSNYDMITNNSCGTPWHDGCR